MTFHQTALKHARATLRRHRQEPRDFAVERDGQWPTLFEAFETISHDSGTAAGHDVYFVPEAWTARLDEIETALCSLPVADFQRFVLPEDDAAGLIAGLNPDLHAANRLLGAFFDDWTGE